MHSRVLNLDASVCSLLGKTGAKNCTRFWLIHTQILVVTCQNLHGRTSTMVEENKVFKQIQQVLHSQYSRNPSSVHAIGQAMPSNEQE